MANVDLIILESVIMISLREVKNQFLGNLMLLQTSFKIMY